jgi:hypothetical protein
MSEQASLFSYIIYHAPCTMHQSAFTLWLAQRIGEQQMLKKSAMKTGLKGLRIKSFGCAVSNYV